MRFDIVKDEHLKHCPKCNVAVDMWLRNDGTAWILCPKCQMRTISYFTRDLAIEAWNGDDFKV